METNEDTPTPGDENVERLIGEAYRPEPIDLRFRALTCGSVVLTVPVGRSYYLPRSEQSRAAVRDQRGPLGKP